MPTQTMPLRARAIFIQLLLVFPSWITTIQASLHLSTFSVKFSEVNGNISLKSSSSLNAGVWRNLLSNSLSSFSISSCSFCPSLYRAEAAAPETGMGFSRLSPACSCTSLATLIAKNSDKNCSGKTHVANVYISAFKIARRVKAPPTDDNFWARRTSRNTR